MRVKIFFVACIALLGACSESEKPSKKVVENGVLVAVDESMIKDSVLVLDESITEVADSLFKGYPQIRAIVGLNLTKVGAGSFKQCENLKEVKAPKLAVIGEKAFEGDGRLASFELNTVPQVGTNAFAGTPEKNIQSTKEPAAFKPLQQYGFYAVNGIPLGTIFEGFKGTYFLFNPGHVEIRDMKLVEAECYMASLKVFNWKGEEVETHAFDNIGVETGYAITGDYLLIWYERDNFADQDAYTRVKLYSRKDLKLLKEVTFDYHHSPSVPSYSQIIGAFVTYDGRVMFSFFNNIREIDMSEGLEPSQRIINSLEGINLSYSGNYIVYPDYVVGWNNTSIGLYVYSFREKTSKEYRVHRIESVQRWNEGSEDAFLVNSKEGDEIYSVKDGKLQRSFENMLFAHKQYPGKEETVWFDGSKLAFTKDYVKATKEVKLPDDGELTNVAFHDGIPQAVAIFAKDKKTKAYLWDIYQDKWKQIWTGGKKTTVIFNN